jgi:hypothetical protein
MEEMIIISRTEYESLKSKIISLHTKDIESKQIVQKLREEISLLKHGRDKGHHLSMGSDNVIDHIPEQCCLCGRSLECVAVRTHSRCQVVDLPKILPEYIEHHSYQKISTCCGGEANTEIYSRGVESPIQYGDN